MKSIDKLREWARGVTNSRPDENIVSPEFVAQECGRKVLLIADEIEAEINERYMLMPMDAGGVPIRCSDTVSGGMGDSGKVQHVEIWPDGFVVVYEHQPGQFTRYSNDAVHHIKPRTLEDVLTDFAEAIEERGTEWVDVSQTANAIRELMKEGE